MRGKKCLSEETRLKMSKSHIGLNTWSKDSHLSEKTKKKISKTLKGRHPVNEFKMGHIVTKATKEKIRQKAIGRKASKKTKLILSIAFKGRLSVIKGKHRSAETIKKMSIANLGKKLSKATKRKISEANKGEKSHFWKGGITPLIRAIRTLFEYKQWRETVFSRDSFTCQDCGLYSGCGKAVRLEAHHKKEFTMILREFLQEYNQFSPFEDQHTLLRLATKYEPFWNIDNGVTLCEDCHKLTKKGNVYV